MGQIDINGQELDDNNNNTDQQNNVTNAHHQNHSTTTVNILHNHNAMCTGEELVDDDHEYYYPTYQWHNASQEMHDTQASITCNAHDQIETYMRTKYTSTITYTDENNKQTKIPKPNSAI